MAATNTATVQLHTIPVPASAACCELQELLPIPSYYSLSVYVYALEITPPIHTYTFIALFHWPITNVA